VNNMSFSKKQFARWNTTATRQKAKEHFEAQGFTNVLIYETEDYGADGQAIDPMGKPCLLEMEVVWKKGWNSVSNFPYRTVLFFSRYAKAKHTQLPKLRETPVYHLQMSQLNQNVGFIAEWMTIRAYGVETSIPTDRGNESNIELSVEFIEMVDVQIGDSV